MLSSRSQIRVRAGSPADAAAVADVFRAAWRQAYRGIIPHAELERMIKRRGAVWWGSAIRAGDSLVVLEVAGVVAGYATHGVSRRRGPYQGEIYELYVAPSHQGLGFGEHLFEACRARLDHRRLDGLVVWALSDNQAAATFYWERGGRPVARAFEQFGDRKLEKIAYGWP